MPAGVSKGTYGALTRSAVRAYQKSKGISQTGFVGPLTRAALNAELGQ
ncbi:MAG: peptidoglycan-binding domain-containing protein [bacterium]|nr:peptidoglycan-binding domain-containing protein [bacterium]